VEGPLPVILSIHGGGWSSGSKARSPAIRFAARGYAVASINYRLSGEAVFPAQIEDCKAAVRWLRANAVKYNLNPDRIAAFGSSAGGHLAALLGTSAGVAELEGVKPQPEESSRVQAVIDFFGPTDLLVMGGMHDRPDSPESRLIGGPIQELKDKAARANPILYLSRDDPPFLIVHGDQDRVVPLRQSQLLHEALVAAGVESTFRVVPGAGHGFSRPEIDELVLAFLERHLKRPVARQGWVDPDRSEPAGTMYRVFHSQSACGEMSYLVYLPPGYHSSQQRYPVIYWLHGIGATQRTGATRAGFVSRIDAAIRNKQMPPVIIVLVNGLRDSWYVDSLDGRRPVESAIIKDLIPHVDATYRTVAARSARAIEGFSMGGFGAAHLGFKFPEWFGAVTIVSGAMLPATEPGNYAAFGFNRDYFLANSPHVLAEKNAAAIASGTRVRILVGEKDPLLEGNRRFHEWLLRLGIPHEFAVIPGVPHQVGRMYEALGDRTPQFYSAVFAAAVGEAAVSAASFQPPRDSTL